MGSLNKDLVYNIAVFQLILILPFSCLINARNGTVNNERSTRDVSKEQPTIAIHFVKY